MARLKKKKVYKTRFIGVRCNDEQYNEIKLKANLYTEGNVSEYVLHAALNYEVSRDDLENEEALNS